MVSRLLWGIGDHRCGGGSIPIYFVSGFGGTLISGYTICGLLGFLIGHYGDCGHPIAVIFWFIRRLGTIDGLFGFIRNNWSRWNSITIGLFGLLVCRMFDRLVNWLRFGSTVFRL